jgi:hypothetical protein
MKYIPGDWTIKQNNLKIFLSKEQTFDDGIKSIWLLDFWEKKNMLGLIMMPITRHQTVHLNDCYNIKEKHENNLL